MFFGVFKIFCELWFESKGLAVFLYVKCILSSRRCTIITFELHPSVRWSQAKQKGCHNYL